MKRLHLIEDTKICLKPVGKIARTVAAPHTKLLEPTKNKHFVIFEIFEEQMLILCKLLILCCKTCFLKCVNSYKTQKTSFHFIENQLIT